jgi:hypothetical protein
MTRPRRKYTRCEDCRRSHVLARLNGRKVKRELRDSAGRLVQFNRGDGWRVGYLVSMSNGGVTIQPIGPKGTIPDTMVVPFSDVKPELMQSQSCPTVEDFYRMNTKKKVVVLIAGKGMAAAVIASSPRGLSKVIAHGSDPLQTFDGTLVQFPRPVQEVTMSTEPEQPRIMNSRKTPLGASCGECRQDFHCSKCACCMPEELLAAKVNALKAAVKTKHPPVNVEEVIRLYKLVPRPKMSAIIEAVRGERAVGATGNVCRDILRKAGIYEEPIK